MRHAIVGKLAKGKQLLAAVILLSLGLPTGVHAQLLYNNGFGDGNIGGYCASCGPSGTYTMMDDFTLGSAQASLMVEWDASWFHILPTATATSDVRISIWSSVNSGQLWTHLFDFQDLSLISVNASSGIDANLTTQAVLSNVNLGAGTYWLSMSGDDMHFTTSGTRTGAIQVHSSNLGTGYNPSQDLPMPFRVYAATAPIPEPETYAMLLAGLGLLGFAARRRKQKETAAA